MKQPVTHRLGDLQLKILQSLWMRGEATVADVHEGLGGSDRYAYTTVATMLRKMEARGLVKHHTEGRSFIYRPSVAETDVSTGMMDHVIDSIFEGSLAEAVNHLLNNRDVSREELRQLEQMISERKKQL
jgi:predicted transcriptional regulator